MLEKSVWDFPGISVHKLVILLSAAWWMNYWLDRFNIGLFWIILRDNGNSSPSVLYHNLSNWSIHNNICCWLQYSYNGSVAKNQCKEEVLQTNSLWTTPKHVCPYQNCTKCNANISSEEEFNVMHWNHKRADQRTKLILLLAKSNLVLVSPKFTVIINELYCTIAK